MTTKRTVKYHVPQQGLYVYARTEEGRTELIVLNSTDKTMNRSLIIIILKVL